MRKWIGMILSILLLSACSSNIELQKQTFTIELGSDVFANPSLYVKDAQRYDLSDAKIMAVSSGIKKQDNRFTNANKQYMVPGEYDFVFVKGSTRIPFKIKIKDTKPPITNKNPETINISMGEAIRWQNFFDASDLSGVSYESEPVLNTSETGSYQVTVTISDRFGNAVEKNVTVNIG
ncbi:MAG: hypothetical protein J6D18_05195 [Erysipelotrichaceae bacterium]|nr:hypothetical protein [Erysipelotrichaceae bacterium]